MSENESELSNQHLQKQKQKKNQNDSKVSQQQQSKSNENAYYNESQFSRDQLERNIQSLDNLEDQKSENIEGDSEQLSFSNLFFIFVSFITSFIFNLITTHLLSLYYSFLECDGKYQMLIIILISNCSAIYTQVISFFYFIDSSSILRFLFCDVFYFQVTFLVVITYFKVCSQKESNCREMCTYDYYSDGQTLQTVNFINNFYGYKFTMPFNKTISRQRIQNKYSAFLLHKTPSELVDTKENPLIQYDQFQSPQMREYLILIAIVIIKLVFAFYYMYLQNIYQQINLRNMIDLSVAIIVQFYSIFLLNKVLGNYDLRQKLYQMNHLQGMIDFSDVQNQKYNEKIEITCPISLETWDTERKGVCAQDYEYLQDLEYSYLCFFFYYIFILIVMIAFYGEFYWLIPKESLLLHPLIVILSTFNFIFLSFFLFFRIWQGQQFNNSFGDIEDSLDFLIDTTKDILTMYEAYFQPYKFMRQQQLSDEEQGVKEIQVENNSVQGLIINKIKLLSNFYIENQVQYQSKVYSSSKKQQLRKQILLTMNESLIKLKTSVQNDSQKYSYKFLNVSEVQFTETLSTTVLASLSFLPQIIPKFIEFYSQQKN